MTQKWEEAVMGDAALQAMRERLAQFRGPATPAFWLLWGQYEVLLLGLDGVSVHDDETGNLLMRHVANGRGREMVIGLAMVERMSAVDLGRAVREWYKGNQ